MLGSYRLLKRLALTLLLTLAAYAGLGRLALGALPSLEYELVGAASERLGAPVALGGIESAWRFLSPGVVLKELAVGDDLRIGHLRVSLDFSRSLLRFDPLIQVDARDLDVRLTRGAGGWRVEAFPGGDEPVDPAAILRIVDRLDVVLDDVEIAFVDGDDVRLAKLARGGLFRQGTHSILDLDVSMTGGARSARLTAKGRYVGGLNERGRLGGGLEIRLSEIDVPFLLPAPQAKLFEPFALDSRLWVNFRFGETRIVTEVNTDGITALGGRPVLGSTELVLSVLGADGLWNVEVERGRLPLAGGELDLTGASAVMRAGHGLGFQFPDLEVTPITSAILAFRDVLPARAVSVLGNGAPRGRVVALRGLAGGEQGVAVAGHIEAASLIGDHAVPSFRDQSGFFSFSPGGGYIEINSQGASELRFSAFDDHWQFDRARGRVTFLPLKTGGIAYSSGLLEVGLGELQARGRFVMNAHPNKLDQTWGLELGIVNAELLDASIYLPNNLAPQFRDWLLSGVKAGHAGASGMLFHGSPVKDAPKETKSYELYLDIAGLTLEYHPDWPQLDDVTAVVYAGNWGARARDALGRVYGSGIDQVDVDVVSEAGLLDRVEVNARLEGAIDDGIRFINQSPLADLTSRVTETWFGTGSIEARGQVIVPLAQQPNRTTHADVTVTLSGNELVMPNYQLDARDVRTVLTYSNEAGLGAEAYTANLLDGRVSGNIESDVYGDRGEIRVVAVGEVAVSRLYRWSRQPVLTQVSGELAYASTLHVPFGPGAMAPYVVVESDLIGVASRLPSPMDKPVETPVDFRYQHTFETSRDLIEWDYDKEVIGRLRIVDGDVLGGEVTFGVGRLLSNSVSEIVVTGELDYADFDDWSEFIDSLQVDSDADLESGFASALDRIEVSVARLDAFGLELEHAGLAITRAEDAWRVVVSNPKVDGVIRVPDADDQPLAVDLAYMRIEGEEDQETDPFEDIDPRDYMPVDFSTRELRVGEDDYGSWQVAFRPDEEGAVLTDVRASVRGLQVVGESAISWRPTRDGGHSTFQGTVRTDDLAKALTEFGYASSIEGKGMQFGADISWPGSPAMIDLLKLKGQVAIESGQGRFVQVERGGTGALKLLGIFDFASLARRFRFDFSDIVDSGYTFDKVTGVVGFNEGRVDIVDPVVIEGASSIFKVGGSVDLDAETLDNDMIVTLPVGRNLPWYAAYSAIATGPLVGAGVFIAQKVFEDQINAMSSAKYKVGGTLDEPQIEFVSIFDARVREGVAENPGAGASGDDGTGVTGAASGGAGAAVPVDGGSETANVSEPAGE